MRREVLLVAEIIDAAERIVALTSGYTVASLDRDRDRREALLWSFTVLGDPVPQCGGRLPLDLWEARLHVVVELARGFSNSRARLCRSPSTYLPRRCSASKPKQRAAESASMS